MAKQISALLSYSNSDDATLIVALVRGESQAWTEFHTRYGRLIERCVRRVLGRFSALSSEDDIREVEARLFLSLLGRDKAKLRNYDPQRGTKFSTWIGLLASHAAYDYLRARRRDPVLDSHNLGDACNPVEGYDLEAMFSRTPSPYEACAIREETAHVSRLLSDFSEKDRQFVNLYFEEGLEPEEVAKEMGISIKTVYTKKHKIRARLEALAERASVAA